MNKKLKTHYYKLLIRVLREGEWDHVFGPADCPSYLSRMHLNGIYFKINGLTYSAEVIVLNRLGSSPAEIFIEGEKLLEFYLFPFSKLKRVFRAMEKKRQREKCEVKEKKLRNAMTIS